MTPGQDSNTVGKGNTTEHNVIQQFYAVATEAEKMFASQVAEVETLVNEEEKKVASSKNVVMKPVKENICEVDSSHSDEHDTEVVVVEEKKITAGQQRLLRGGKCRRNLSRTQFLVSTVITEIQRGQRKSLFCLLMRTVKPLRIVKCRLRMRMLLRTMRGKVLITAMQLSRTR